MTTRERELADIAVLVGLPTAGLFGQLADDADQAAESDTEYTFDVVDGALDTLDQMIEDSPAGRGKPCDDTCWKRHVRCALERVRELLDDYERPER